MANEQNFTEKYFQRLYITEKWRFYQYSKMGERTVSLEGKYNKDERSQISFIYDTVVAR
jgi:hypothetical protein